MKDAKPKPKTSSKVALREPAKPLAEPETKPPSPDHPIFNLIGPALTAEAPTTHHPPATTHPPPTTPIAPERDFVRVPNSVVRDALPSGLFKGESKKTYDALYQRTRGAVVPRRAVRSTLADVQVWAGVSHNTLKAHLKHLSKAGLLKIHYTRGDNTGAEYEVFTPEEATHHPPPTHLPATSQILGPPTTQNLVVGGGGQMLDLQRTSAPDKTSFKTNTERIDDDEPFGPLIAAAREVAGRELTHTDLARFRELAELLVTELKIAAGRTTVSSVPAFLTEHLRRRLWKKERKQVEQEAVAGAAEPSPAVDASQCSDCFGTGMYYPEGFDKGVARCRHEKLTANHKS
jgi:hypothetical protein